MYILEGGFWLFPLSKIILRFVILLHVSVVHFPFFSEEYFIFGIYHNLFIHSAIDRHLGYFQLLVIRSKAPVNIPCAGVCIDIWKVDWLDRVTGTGLTF